MAKVGPGRKGRRRKGLHVAWERARISVGIFIRATTFRHRTRRNGIKRLI